MGIWELRFRTLEVGFWNSDFKALSFRPDLLFGFKIQVIMIFTTRIERCGASRAGVVALHVLGNG